jgi:hypothetical protein
MDYTSWKRAMLSQEGITFKAEKSEISLSRENVMSKIFLISHKSKVISTKISALMRVVYGK